MLSTDETATVLVRSLRYEEVRYPNMEQMLTALPVADRQAWNGA